MMTAAGDLKYTREIKRLLAEQLENPSDEFVKFCASKVFNGTLTQARREYFSHITKRSFHQLINERIDYRLKSAMSGHDTPASQAEAEAAEAEGVVVTTAEEMEGFYIIKSILREIVDPARIAHRDTQSYMGILLDDNNRKPLVRLYFNRARKQIGVFDENRKEERVPIDSLNDIYQHGDKMKRVLAFYERERAAGKKEPESAPEG